MINAVSVRAHAPSNKMGASRVNNNAARPAMSQTFGIGQKVKTPTVKSKGIMVAVSLFLEEAKSRIKFPDMSRKKINMYATQGAFNNTINPKQLDTLKQLAANTSEGTQIVLKETGEFSKGRVALQVTSASNPEKAVTVAKSSKGLGIFSNAKLVERVKAAESRLAG